MNILQMIKEQILRRQRLEAAQLQVVTVYRGIPYKRTA
jgi:hypothetical protein